MQLDLSLYLIADTEVKSGKPFLTTVEEAVMGGVTVVQFRSKKKNYDESLALAHALRTITRSMQVPLIINDDVAMAKAVDADGIHLGQNDMDIEQAREILGKDKIIGLSAHTVPEAIEAEKKKANYIGVGTVFATTSKSDIIGIIGTDGLRTIRRETTIPIVGIGGITIYNVGSVMETGVSGVAVIAAIMGSENPRIEARELKSVIDKHKYRGVI